MAVELVSVGNASSTVLFSVAMLVYTLPYFIGFRIGNGMGRGFPRCWRSRECPLTVWLPTWTEKLKLHSWCGDSLTFSGGKEEWPTASIFEGQPLKTRPFLSKTRVIFGFEDVNDLQTYLNPKTRPGIRFCIFMTRSIHHLKQCLQMTAAKPKKYLGSVIRIIG